MTNRSTLEINDKILWMFATPVVAFQWPNSEKLNIELASLIIKREKSEKRNVQLSNAGGWQSSNDLLAWKSPAVDELKYRIDCLLYSTLVATSVNPKDSPKAKFRIDCWANVNREGDYNLVHNHPNSLWSGVYYVSAGNPDPNTPQAGKIELLDPRDSAGIVQINRSMINQKCFLKNDPGLMLMFPSWLKHMVHPHKGTKARISIAFNAMPIFS